MSILESTETQNLSFYLKWSHVLSCSGSPRYFPLTKIRPDQFNLNTQKWIWYLHTFESSAIKFSQRPRRCHGGAALIKACAFAFPCSCACLCLGGKAAIWCIEHISSLGQQHHGSHASLCGSLLCEGTGSEAGGNHVGTELQDMLQSLRAPQQLPSTPGKVLFLAPGRLAVSSSF